MIKNAVPLSKLAKMNSMTVPDSQITASLVAVVDSAKFENKSKNRVESENAELI